MKNNSYVKNSNVIDVGELTNDEKFQLFTSIINVNLENKNLYNDDSEIRKFLEKIPSFPLDVSVAAYYIKETGMPYVDYLKHIFTPTEEFTVLQENILVNANEYSKTRYSIITLSIQRLIDKNPDFVGLLLFISLLDSRAIPKELLVTYKGYVVVSDFLNQLNRNSFITNISKDAINGRNNQKFFSIHRSTQTIIFSYLTKLLNLGSNDELLKPIINSMGNYVSNLVELEDTLKLKTLQNHCESMLIYGDHIFNERENSVIEVVLGVIFYYLGYDEKAQQKLENNLEILKKYNDSDGISVAWALLHLGGVYRKLGTDYPKSIELLTNSIDIYKKRYPTNIGVALALTHLGNVYRTIGNFEQAKTVLQESIKVYQKHLGNYSGLAKALSSLGVVYTEQGDYEEAKDLLEQGLEIQDKYHYPKYSSVYARTLAHLGIVNRMIGNYEDAKKLLQESIDIYQCIWPKDHRDISRNIMNLGIIHSELGEYQKARKLLKKSLADYERIYGQDHIKTSRVLNYLGRCHIIGGDLDTAENLVSRALIIFRQHSHPETYVSLELLGDIYSEKTKKVRIKDGDNITFKNYRNQATDYFKQAIKVVKLYFVNNSIHIRRIEQKMKNIINQST